ncbi:MAG: gliding motility-associated C-terminal domain-containing protein [Crocinitomicaceae bacterium]|nr:gliding motility-associated C-terminal domain-containing protein [Crocinitomicaceae bacterium]
MFSLDFLSRSKTVFFNIFLFFVFSLTAQQNLVPNGSFEEYYSCPTGNNLNDGQFERCKRWWSPTECSPDYFNVCNNNINGVVGVPNNFWGYQNPFEGNGYVGFIPVMVDGVELGSEYFRTELFFPLKPCVNYHFSMYISLANYSTHGLNKIGAYFSKDNSFQLGCKQLIESSQVKYTGIPIIDSVNWTKIEGTFTAEGGERFLTIGFFDEDIDTVFVQFSLGSYFHPYYYVDNVSLYEVGENLQQPCDFHLEIPNVFTPNNDGTNDVIDLSKYLDFIDNVRIINRWGNTVEILTKDNPIWDGNNCTDGIYYYLIEDEKIKTKQNGFIHLIR